MNNLAGYMLGVALHVAFKWGNWKQGAKDKPWGAYWSDYAGVNVASAVSAIVCFSLWDLGLVAQIVEWARPGTAVPMIPVTPGTSILMGFVMDSIARTAMMMLQRRAKDRAEAGQ